MKKFLQRRLLPQLKNTMRPVDLKTKIFLDGGDPAETKAIIDQLGFLDGQTTNPTLIAKNPAAQERVARGEKFSQDEVYDFYRGVVTEMSQLIPNGSISIEVYADATTSAEAMYQQAVKFNTWIPNAHIKYPITAAGLAAAEHSVRDGLRVNMTLCFSQEQAAAVYAATAGATKGQVFISPFVGRLDDRGENGMDLIANILKMYQPGDGHVEVLVASVRSLDHFLAALAVGSDIITAPASVLRAWAEGGLAVPDSNFSYQPATVAPVAYRDIIVTQPWSRYDISHPLTNQGLERFVKDWQSIIAW